MIEIAPLGISGSQVSLCQDSTKFFVHKTGTKRLLAQAKKQNSARCSGNGIYVPQIYNYSESHIDMEYIHGYSILDLIEVGSMEQLRNYFNTLLSLLEWELENSEIKITKVSVFVEKLDSVKNELSSLGLWTLYTARMFDSIYDLIKSHGETLEIPIGECHGDLTFSNTIICNDMKTIALVDFLDTYLESPFQDIAKIQQELITTWTPTRANSFLLNSPKVHSAYGLFKGMFLNFIPPVYRQLFKLFYVMTLVRLLPYVPRGEFEYILMQIEETL